MAEAASDRTGPDLPEVHDVSPPKLGAREFGPMTSCYPASSCGPSRRATSGGSQPIWRARPIGFHDS